MLYIARHGQTDWNRARRYQARTDVPVNATGRRQAQAVRTLFTQMDVRFVRAVCSPLGRAVETMGIILDGTGLAASVVDEFVEIDLGQWEGRYGDDLEAEFGERYTRWRDDCYPTAAPGGESMGDLIRRVEATACSLAGEAQHADLLIVAHQATNIAIKAAISGARSVDKLREFKQSNNEVDIWDPSKGHFLARLTAVSDEPSAD